MVDRGKFLLDPATNGIFVDIQKAGDLLDRVVTVKFDQPVIRMSAHLEASTAVFRGELQDRHRRNGIQPLSEVARRLSPQPSELRLSLGGFDWQWAVGIGMEAVGLVLL
jgi:hypothetical protein